MSYYIVLPIILNIVSYAHNTHIPWMYNVFIIILKNRQYKLNFKINVNFQHFFFFEIT